MLKRWLSAALACLTAASGFTAVEVSAASVTEEAAYDRHGGLAFAEFETVEFPDGIEYSPDDNVFHISAAQLIRPFSLFSSNTRNFYDLLTGAEKNAYDMMKIALQMDHTVAIVDLIGITDLETAERAYCALVADHPEFFWLFGVQFAYVQNDDGSLSELDIRFNYCAGQTESNIESNYKAVMNAVNRIVGEADKYGSDYEKIKYFAEYISDNMVYNSNAANKGGPEDAAYANCWNAYGALISGNGVCEAYAEAFKLLCDAAGIPCISVYSLDHEWNAVKLDGSWYYVDVTWIDSGSKSTYRYDQWLAVGTATAKKNDNSIGSHTQSSKIILAGFDSGFTYPDISLADYKPASEPDNGSDPGKAPGTGTGGGSGTGTSTRYDLKNKDVNAIGSTKYTFTASVASPVIDVSIPTGISAVINPYGVPIRTKDGDYGADGIISPVYTVRNKTETSAIAIYAKAYLTVPKDKTGMPSITVCGSPDEVKSKDEKAMSAYLLTCVSESGAADADSESKDLIQTNNVQYAKGKTIVFADATVNSENSNNGTLMVIPKANYEGGTLKDYYYGHFMISGAVTPNSRTEWSTSDKVTLTVIFDILPCPDPS